MTAQVNVPMAERASSHPALSDHRAKSSLLTSTITFSVDLTTGYCTRHEQNLLEAWRHECQGLQRLASQPGGRGGCSGVSQGWPEGCMRLLPLRMSSLMRRWMLLMSRFQPGFFLLVDMPLLASATAAVWELPASISTPSLLHCSASTCTAFTPCRTSPSCPTVVYTCKLTALPQQQSLEKGSPMSPIS